MQTRLLIFLKLSTCDAELEKDCMQGILTSAALPFFDAAPVSGHAASQTRTSSRLSMELWPEDLPFKEVLAAPELNGDQRSGSGWKPYQMSHCNRHRGTAAQETGQCQLSRAARLEAPQTAIALAKILGEAIEVVSSYTDSSGQGIHHGRSHHVNRIPRSLGA